MKKRNKIEKAKLMVVRKHWFQQGELAERERLIKRVESFFELTQWSTKYEGGEENPEWDRGYQAAMAILKGESSEREDN